MLGKWLGSIENLQLNWAWPEILWASKVYLRKGCLAQHGKAVKTFTNSENDKKHYEKLRFTKTRDAVGKTENKFINVRKYWKLTINIMNKWGLLTLRLVGKWLENIGNPQTPWKWKKQRTEKTRFANPRDAWQIIVKHWKTSKTLKMTRTTWFFINTGTLGKAW